MTLSVYVNKEKETTEKRVRVEIYADLVCKGVFFLLLNYSMHGCSPQLQYAVSTPGVMFVLKSGSWFSEFHNTMFLLDLNFSKGNCLWKHSSCFFFHKILRQRSEIKIWRRRPTNRRLKRPMPLVAVNIVWRLIYHASARGWFEVWNVLDQLELFTTAHLI